MKPIVDFFKPGRNFRKIKRPGIRRLNKSALFEKKKFFSIWIKSIKTICNLGGIRSPIALLGYPSALLPNKRALLLKWGALFWRQFDSNLSFFINSSFFHISRLIDLFYVVWDIITYMLWNLHVDYENKILNRNAHNALINARNALRKSLL